MVNGAWQNAWNTIVSVISGIWNDFKTNAMNLWNEVCDFVSNIWNTVSEIWDKVWSTITDTISKWWNAIRENAQKGWDKAVNFVKTLWDTIDGWWSKTWTTITTNITAVWEKFKKFVKDTWEKVGESVKDIWNGVKDAWVSIWKGLGNFIGGVINGILGGIQAVINGVISGVNKVIEVLNNLDVHIPDWVPLFGGETIGFDLKQIGQITLPRVNIPTFANGGFPEDGWFRASQGEIMGQFDNGRSVVANNEQITDGIARAVSASLVPVLNDIAQSNKVIASKDTVLRVDSRDIAKANNTGQSKLGKSLISFT
jgi:hypothetical protein